MQPQTHTSIRALALTPVERVHLILRGLIHMPDMPRPRAYTHRGRLTATKTGKAVYMRDWRRRHPDYYRQAHWREYHRAWVTQHRHVNVNSKGAS